MTVSISQNWIEPEPEQKPMNLQETEQIIVYKWDKESLNPY